MLMTVHGVRAGTHELEVQDSSSHQRIKRKLMLPALELADDARAIFMGAHVQVWIG